MLTELSAVQDELLAFLTVKRKLLGAADAVGLAGMQHRELDLTERLQRCHERRGELLAQAAGQGLPSDSLRALGASLPKSERQSLDDSMRQAAARSRLLQHHSLTNWVLTQRTLLHLAQLLEIIGTGGRTSPTYGKGELRGASGAMVDHAA
ncbi:MAG: flagellar export chaperone FlgN [Pirellulales bacterium]